LLRHKLTTNLVPWSAGNALRKTDGRTKTQNVFVSDQGSERTAKLGQTTTTKRSHMIQTAKTTQNREHDSCDIRVSTDFSVVKNMKIKGGVLVLMETTHRFAKTTFTGLRLAHDDDSKTATRDACRRRVARRDIIVPHYVSPDNSITSRDGTITERNINRRFCIQHYKLRVIIRYIVEKYRYKVWCLKFQIAGVT